MESDYAALRGKIEEAERRDKAATEGPWKTNDGGDEECIYVETPRYVVDERGAICTVFTDREKPTEQERADAAFIAASRTLVPSLSIAARAALEVLVPALKATMAACYCGGSGFYDDPSTDCVECVFRPCVQARAALAQFSEKVGGSNG